MSKPPRGVRWATYVKHMANLMLNVQDDICKEIAYRMIKKIINKISIMLANKNWDSKRRYLIKKGAIIGTGTRLNCGVDAFGTEPFFDNMWKRLLVCGGGGTYYNT